MTTQDGTPRLIVPPEAIAFLEAQHPRGLHLLGLIREGEVGLVDWVPDGVLQKGKTSYCLLSTSPEATASLLDRVPWDGPVSFTALPSELAGYVVERGTVSWRDQFWLYYLPPEAHLPRASISVGALTLQDAPTVHEFWPYADESNVHYIQERIERGITAGIRIGDGLVAWALTHTSGAIGFMHVLESHRRKGYAEAIAIRLIAETRARGWTPFVYISVRNGPSLGLAEKLGMLRVEQVEWLALNEP